MSMKVIPAVVLNTAMVASSVPEVAPAMFSAGATYAAGDRVGVAGAAGLVTVYRSLQGGNLNHPPATSPIWWKAIGTTYLAYSNSTAYAKGDRVIDVASHAVYEALIATTGAALTDRLAWFRVGSTNAWAMFYLLRSDVTVSPDPITVVISPGVRIDSIVLRKLKASSAQITVRVAGNVVYSATKNLTMRNTTTWSQYYRGVFDSKSSLGVFDIPMYSNSEVTIVLTNANGNVECGYCILGMSEKIGDVKRGVQSDVLNFSSVTRDKDGIGEMVPSRNVPKTVSDIYADKATINRVRWLRDSLNGSVAAWVGIANDADDYFDTLLLVGFYRRFTITLRDNTGYMVALELEEI